MECESKIMASFCNCVLYYMPRPKDEITICGRSDEHCVNEVTRQLQLKTNQSFYCECLPGCFAINYESEISTAPLMPRAPALQERRLLFSNVAVVHIFFRDNYFRSQKKDELVGFTDFLCNFNMISYEMFFMYSIP